MNQHMAKEAATYDEEQEGHSSEDKETDD